MGNYNIIADVSHHLISVLRENMVPEIVLSPESIGLCQPFEKGDIVLGVYLYDIKQSEDIFMRGLQNVGLSQQKYPPIFLDLFYMVTAFSTSDIKFRAIEEQKMLGKVIQLFKDYPLIDTEHLNQSATLSKEMKIEMLKLTNDEKMKLWNFPSIDYHLTLFYKVSAVEIESTKEKTIKRVTDVEMSVKEK